MDLPNNLGTFLGKYQYGINFSRSVKNDSITCVFNEILKNVSEKLFFKTPGSIYFLWEILLLSDLSNLLSVIFLRGSLYRSSRTQMFYKELFRKISPTVVRVVEYLFDKIVGCWSDRYSKRDTDLGVFPCMLRNFSDHLFVQNSSWPLFLSVADFDNKLK